MLFKKFKIFEKYKENHKMEDYKLSNITDDNFPEVSDRVFHVNSGPGTVSSDEHGLVEIKFDMSPSTKDIFLLSSLIKNGLLRMIDEEPIDDINIPESEFKNVPGRENIKEIIAKPIEEPNPKEREEEEDEEEEEMEEEDDDDDFILDDITAEELMTMKIDEFFNEDEIKLLVSLDNVLNFRNSIENLDDKDLNPFKIVLKNKKIRMTYLMELYYNHLMDRIPGKPIYRFNGQIPYPELWDIREKDRIEIPKELKDDAVFDSGGLYFWVFSNAIIFKTI